jgi:hypothetical protein
MAKVYRAPENIPTPDFGAFITKTGFDNEGYRKAEEAFLADLAEAARRNGTSDLLGEEVRWHRGDGYARYMIWKTSPLQLIWLELGDAWSVEDALIRGLRVADLREMVDQARRRAELFSTRRSA